MLPGHLAPQGIGQSTRFDTVVNDRISVHFIVGFARSLRPVSSWKKELLISELNFDTMTNVIVLVLRCDLDCLGHQRLEVFRASNLMQTKSQNDASPKIVILIRYEFSEK